jgi:hypothetical protein
MSESGADIPHHTSKEPEEAGSSIGPADLVGWHVKMRRVPERVGFFSEVMDRPADEVSRQLEVSGIHPLTHEQAILAFANQREAHFRRLGFTGEMPDLDAQRNPRYRDSFSAKSSGLIDGPLIELLNQTEPPDSPTEYYGSTAGVAELLEDLPESTDGDKSVEAFLETNLPIYRRIKVKSMEASRRYITMPDGSSVDRFTLPKSQ